LFVPPPYLGVKGSSAVIGIIIGSNPILSCQQDRSRASSQADVKLNTVMRFTDGYFACRHLHHHRLENRHSTLAVIEPVTGIGESHSDAEMMVRLAGLIDRDGYPFRIVTWLRGYVIGVRYEPLMIA
jgi:hypothetical protein